jgi:U3 small nucleolar RNA-associated protein 23
MRGKRYRKLMNQYETSFGFRPPYQVLVDAEMIRDSELFKMDLAHLLKRTLHNDIKPSKFLLVPMSILSV